MSQDYAITRNDADDRFETTVDGVLCVLEYRLHDGVMTITHTGVPEAVGGRGIAAALTQHAFDEARRQGWRVVPACAYSVAWLARHADYASLVERG